MILRRANLKRWAAYGCLAGLAMGALRLQYPWEGDGIRLNLIELFSMGLGYAFVGLVLGAIWNRVGKV